VAYRSSSRSLFCARRPTHHGDRTRLKQVHIRKLASEEVTVQLMMKTKCLSVLYYALEAYPINKSQIKALDCVLFSSFSKIFRIKSKDVVDECILLGCSSVLTVVISVFNYCALR